MLPIVNTCQLCKAVAEIQNFLLFRSLCWNSRAWWEAKPPRPWGLMKRILMKTSRFFLWSRWWVMNSVTKWSFPAAEPEPTIYLRLFPQVNAGLLILMVLPVPTSRWLNHIHALSHPRPPHLLQSLFSLCMRTRFFFFFFFEYSSWGHYIREICTQDFIFFLQISFSGSSFPLPPSLSLASTPYYLPHERKKGVSES